MISIRIQVNGKCLENLQNYILFTHEMKQLCFSYFFTIF
uniref:Uncharacterized protein n=1 Tax=Tetranychus urticae TaxID=32264 RepID=T1L4Z8_TETUR